MFLPALGSLFLVGLLGVQESGSKPASRACRAEAPAPAHTFTQALALQALARFLPGAVPQALPPSVPFLAPGPRKIGNSTANLALPPSAGFGTSVAAIGDLDGDGVQDLAVGAPRDGFGSVRILFLRRDRTVRAHARIDSPDSWSSEFGTWVCGLGDLDGDGARDIAVSAPFYGVSVFRLRPDGTVKSSAFINVGVFPGETMGEGIAAPGDMDGDGVPDLVLGVGMGVAGSDPRLYTVFLRPDGTMKSNRRTVSLGYVDVRCWALDDLDGDGIREIAAHGFPSGIFFLNPDGTVQGSTPLPSSLNGYNGMDGVHDFDGDGVPDLAFGSPDRNQGRGRYSLARLDSAGNVIPGTIRDVDGPNGHMFYLSERDGFGASLAFLGNLDGAGSTDIAVGAPETDDGGIDCGAVWIADTAPRR